MLAPLHVAPLAYLVILAIILASVYALKNPLRFEAWRMHPYAIYRRQRLDTLFTSLFVHVDVAHLGINAGLLCFVLPDVEFMLVDDFGWWWGRLLLLFCIVFVAGFAGSLSAIQHRSDQSHRSAGASGLVCALVMVYLVYLPIEPIRGLPGFMHDVMPFWIAMSFVAALVLVAAMAMLVRIPAPASAIHLYGALAGVLLTFVIRPASFGEIAQSLSSCVVSEKRDDESAGHDHVGDHADNDTASERFFAAFAALDGVRLVDTQWLHPLGNHQCGAMDGLSMHVIVI